MKSNFILILILLPFLLKAQGGLIIGNGTKVVISNSPQIVVNDGRFVNEGDFSAGSSTVHITGSTPTEHATIGGAAITAFNNLTIAKNSNDTRLDYDIRVDGDLQMNGGLLIMNYSDIVLGGKIIGETGTNRITGTDGGAIIKTVTLDMPLIENPGNLGAEITSVANLGLTTIRRSHVQLINGNKHSIFRHYDIIPANNSNLDATLRLHYFEEELAGLDENSLEIWQNDGSNWDSFGSEDSNTTENWVEASGISFFHTLTLAEDMSSPLPIELLSFEANVNDKMEVVLRWATATEINNDYFTIERSKDGVYFESIEDIPGAGNTFQAREYHTVDQTPFAGISYYRLKQTDFDGTFSYSDIKVVNIQLDQRFTVYPNPLKEVLHIVGDGNTKGKTIIEIFDAVGNLKYYKRLDMDEQITSLVINEVSKFIAGSYLLVIQTREDTFTFKLVKARM